MKIAVGIIALLLAVGVGMQSCAVGVGSSFIGDENTAGAGGGGLFVSLLFIVGGAFAFAKPKIAKIIFIAAASIAFLSAANSKFQDLYFWGGAAAVLAVMSHYGMRETEAVAVQQNAVQTGSASVGEQASGKYCVKCGAKNSTDAVFCSKCGSSQG